MMDTKTNMETRDLKTEAATKTETAIDKAQDAATQAKDKAGETVTAAKEQVKRTAAQVGDQAKTTVDSRLGEVAQELDNVAGKVRQTSYNVGDGNDTVVRYGERIAEQIEGVSSYLDEHGVEEILTDIQDFARRQPAVFLGGAFMLGLVVGRFLRSSGDRGMRYDEGFNSNYSTSGGNRSTGSGGSGGMNDYTGRNRYQTGLTQESTTTQDWS
jgi:hypothetical protein